MFAWLTTAIESRLDPPGPHGRATEVTTLPAAARRFLTHPRPPVLLATVGVLAAARGARGRPSRRDARVAGLCLLAQPFVEHAVHRWMLHSAPTNAVGRACYRFAGWGHEQHHADPTNLDTMFLRPVDVLGGGLLAAAAGAAGPPAAATGALCVGLGTLAYDWSHFLIHSGYQPRGRLARAVKRNHRLHHYRNERYWLGVTSPVADIVLRTNPPREAVPVTHRAARQPITRQPITSEPVDNEPVASTTLAADRTEDHVRAN